MIGKVFKNTSYSLETQIDDSDWTLTTAIIDLLIQSSAMLMYQVLHFSPFML